MSKGSGGWGWVLGALLAPLPRAGAGSEGAVTAGAVRSFGGVNSGVNSRCGFAMGMLQVTCEQRTNCGSSGGAVHQELLRALAAGRRCPVPRSRAAPALTQRRFFCPFGAAVAAASRSPWERGQPPRPGSASRPMGRGRASRAAASRPGLAGSREISPGRSRHPAAAAFP